MDADMINILPQDMKQYIMAIKQGNCKYFSRKIIISIFFLLIGFSLTSQTLQLDVVQIKKIFNQICDENNASLEIRLSTNDSVSIVPILICSDCVNNDTMFMKLLNRLIALDQVKILDHRFESKIPNKIGHISFSSHFPEIRIISIYYCANEIFRIEGIDLNLLLKVDGIFGLSDKLEFIRIFQELYLVDPSH